MTKKEIKQKMTEYLDNLTNVELLSVYNEYCYNVYYYDDIIEEAERINEIFMDTKPYDIMLNVAYGDFHSNAEYFKFDGYGNIQSIYETEIKDYVCIEDIVEYCIDYNENLADDNIKEMLEKLN